MVCGGACRAWWSPVVSLQERRDLRRARRNQQGTSGCGKRVVYSLAEWWLRRESTNPVAPHQPRRGCPYLRRRGRRRAAAVGDRHLPARACRARLRLPGTLRMSVRIEPRRQQRRRAVTTRGRGGPCAICSGACGRVLWSGERRCARRQADSVALIRTTSCLTAWSCPCMRPARCRLW